MSQAIPLPEDTTRATEGALDKSKPHALPPRQPHQDPHQSPPQAQPARPSAAGEEHPLSVGQP